MSRLIQIRQRLKAIGTIKKIAHAMRLISMSTHTLMKKNEDFLNSYRKEINLIFGQVAHATPTWHSTLFNPTADEPHALVILVGSQKGLCGTFNHTLFHFFADRVQHIPKKNRKVIAIGRKAVEHVKQDYGQIVASFYEFKSSNLPLVTQEIIHLISTTPQPYTSVTLFGNKPEGFFVQKPLLTDLIPFDPVQMSVLAEDKPTTRVPDFVWEQDPHDLLDLLAEHYVRVNVRTHLFNSLLAEQAARFVSMDSATRNAETMVDDLKLQYNKIRQTKITKELTELASSFQIQD